MEQVEALDRRIESLRTQVRQALTAGDRERVAGLRRELREAQREWDALLDDELETAPRVPAPRPATGPLLPVREQVHQALTLLGAPAAPKLVVAVHDAFSTGELTPTKLTSLRRDEERSFQSAPYSRPYYLCAALTADLLAPARGLIAVSTWPMATRVIGPLSQRVDFLTAAINLADHLDRLAETGPNTRRLLWRFAATIPGAATSASSMSPAEVADAARAELAIHIDDDRSHREAAAKRAVEQLSPAQQLFGTRLGGVAAATGT
ncbi:hypothetical protein JIG36_36685 [Actinoplanes sp. LDG1-06]|uniref:Uncharacterized protein n=1 Tax=Paractinoplanes ovalisporus TaxID=2810368 RepID=A0ABS2AMI4_9ACTN|nr:hypothetical protein [Actinoplanes ovalisporus]MBM2621052.1 hypothetical protein [Actinoplanes ovalisporus]